MVLAGSGSFPPFQYKVSPVQRLASFQTAKNGGLG